MWNPNCKGYQEVSSEEDDSWEVKAFEQDIKGNIAGITWPPRSYTCNFCRREFRSAQALGGHMNVHRRDRGTPRVHGSPVAHVGTAAGVLNLLNSTSSSCFVPPLPNQNMEGLCHFYQLQNRSGIFGNSGNMNHYGAIDASSPHSTAPNPPVPPYLSCNFTFSPTNFPVDFPQVLDSYAHHHHHFSATSSIHDNGNTRADSNGQNKLKEIGTSEAPDLELRLGHKAAAHQPP